MTPRASGEPVDARLELAVVGGRGQQRSQDLKAQTCPSHARARRGVVVGHGPPAPPTSRAAAKRPYAHGKNMGSAIFCAKRGAPCGYIAPLTKRDPSGQLVVVIGASQAMSFAERAALSPSNRSRIEVGSRRRSGAGTSRADGQRRARSS